MEVDKKKLDKVLWEFKCLERTIDFWNKGKERKCTELREAFEELLGKEMEVLC